MEYQTARSTHGPHNGPLESVEGLEQVLAKRVRQRRALRLTDDIHTCRGGVETMTSRADSNKLVYADHSVMSLGRFPYNYLNFRLKRVTFIFHTDADHSIVFAVT